MKHPDEATDREIRKWRDDLRKYPHGTFSARRVRRLLNRIEMCDGEIAGLRARLADDHLSNARIEDAAEAAWRVYAKSPKQARKEWSGLRAETRSYWREVAIAAHSAGQQRIGGGA